MSALCCDGCGAATHEGRPIPVGYDLERGLYRLGEAADAGELYVYARCTEALSATITITLARLRTPEELDSKELYAVVPQAEALTGVCGQWFRGPRPTIMAYAYAALRVAEKHSLAENRLLEAVVDGIATYRLLDRKPGDEGDGCGG